MEAYVPGMRWCPYDENGVANIIAAVWFPDNGYRVTYDSTVEDAFTVYDHDDTELMKFVRNEDGLYIFEMPCTVVERIAQKKKMAPPPLTMHMNDDYYNDDDSIDDEFAGPTDQHSYMVSTVKENRLGYTEKDFQGAKRARTLYRILGCPTTEHLRQFIRQNLAQDNPVTVTDVNNAEKIFGPDVGTLKGKSTRSKPVPIKEDVVAIPKEITEQYTKLVLHFDLMFINGLPLLTCIDGSIRYRITIPLNNQTAKELYSALDKVFRHYNGAGFLFKFLSCDQQFKPLMDPIKDKLDATMNYFTQALVNMNLLPKGTTGPSRSASAPCITTYPTRLYPRSC